MARRTNKLSAAAVTSKTWKPGAYADGLGLYLQVAEGGSKSWLFRFMRNGRARKMGLGATHTVTLAEAREKARDARKQLLEGVDPIQARKAKFVAIKLEAARAVTFRKCALDYIADHEASWTNEKHAHQWSASLEKHAFPLLGNLPVSEIDLPLILKVIKPIWHKTPETANRVRGRIETVLGWATTHEYRTGDNPARWKGHLEKPSSSPKQGSQGRDHAAMPYAEVPAFMAQLRTMSSVGARALEFTILCATRTSETIKAQWPEIDFAGKMWTIPADRMRAGREQRIPLSDRALAILADLPREKDNDFVFVGASAGSSLSDQTMAMMLKRMGHRDITIHGFVRVSVIGAATQQAIRIMSLKWRLPMQSAVRLRKRIGAAIFSTNASG